MKFFTKLSFVSFAVTILSVVFAQAQLTIQSGALLKTTGSAVITLKDIDLVNDGIINQQTGEGRFVFAGTADNNISGGSNPLFDIFEIAKTGSAKILLSQNINVGSAINFTSGLIDLNSNNILLQPTALLNGEDESSRVTGTSGGYVEITNTLNAPSAINSGNLGAVITSSQNLGSTTIRRGHASQVNAIGGGNSIYRYFEILPANNSSLNAILRISYFNAELNSLDPNALVIWKSTDNIHWSNEGFGTRDAVLNYVEQSGITDFSRWTLSSLNNPLPLSFTSFLVTCANGSAIISWKTGQEQNSSRFDVQKSADGIYWQTISELAAAGTSNIEKSYSYTDVNSSSGKSFYRIAEHDLNNIVNYSAIASVNCGNEDNELNVYPNPVKDVLWVSVNAGDNSMMQIQIFDSKGSSVHPPVINSGSSNKYGINMKSLPSGFYMLLIWLKDGNKVKTVKVIKD